MMSGMKKVMRLFAVVFAVLCFGVVNTTSVNASASFSSQVETQSSSVLGGSVYSVVQNTMAAHFLGLPAWYDNLPTQTDASGNVSIAMPSGQDEISVFVWTIVMNIAGMILGIAGYVCILIVIYGGYMYLFSMGDPGKTVKGKKAIINALIGIGICMFASTISTVVGGLLNGVADSSDGALFFNHVFNHAMVWAGVICVLIITIAGVRYAMSNGDPGMMQKAKMAMVYAFIGLAIILLSAGIVNFVIGALL